MGGKILPRGKLFGLCLRVYVSTHAFARLLLTQTEAPGKAFPSHRGPFTINCYEIQQFAKIFPIASPFPLPFLLYIGDAIEYL